ncbi:hypothetical protein GQR61_05660, partial [Campylobacter lari]|nr:hypothetical protein [Campylobacter lari]
MRILTLFLISLIFISCAKVSPNYFQSSFTVYEKKVNYNEIADDFIQLLSSYYPPNKTTLFLNEEKSNKDFFDYFILSIRKKGYAISNDNSRKNLTFLSYQISQIDNETIVAIFN